MQHFCKQQKLSLSSKALTDKSIKVVQHYSKQ